MKTQLPARPAEEFEPLQAQLQGALERLERGDSEPSGPWRAYLRQLMSLVWRKLSKGDLTAPRRALQALSGSHAFVEAHLPQEQLPRAEAARELHFAWKSLEMAERAAEAASLDVELRDRHRSATEREILRVLFAASGRFLRRGKIHEAMHLEGRRPSPARISQLLNRLFEQGLLLRKSQKAKGAAEVGFYSLSEAGQKFCQEQFTEEEPEDEYSSFDRCLVYEPFIQTSIVQPIGHDEFSALRSQRLDSFYDASIVGHMVHAGPDEDVQRQLVDVQRSHHGLIPFGRWSGEASHVLDVLTGLDAAGGQPDGFVEPRLGSNASSSISKPTSMTWLINLAARMRGPARELDASVSGLVRVRTDLLRAQEKESLSTGVYRILDSWVSGFASRQRASTPAPGADVSTLARIIYTEAMQAQKREPRKKTVSKFLRQLETEVWKLANSGPERSESTIAQSYNPPRTSQDLSSGKRAPGKSKP